MRGKSFAWIHSPTHYFQDYSGERESLDTLGHGTWHLLGNLFIWVRNFCRAHQKITLINCDFFVKPPIHTLPFAHGNLGGMYSKCVAVRKTRGGYLIPLFVYKVDTSAIKCGTGRACILTLGLLPVLIAMDNLHKKKAHYNGECAHNERAGN